MSTDPADLPTGVVDARLTDDEAARLWSESGARWLTAPGVAVPGTLVRRVVGLAETLDERGAALDGLVAARGLGLLAERAGTMGLPAGDHVSCGGATRLVVGAAGPFALTLAREADLEMVPALVEAPVEPGDEWSAVELAATTRHDLVERARLLGLPAATVGEVEDDRPVLLDRVGPAAPRPLTGSVVVTLAALWAGPLCADVLARMGARVITVESTRRPDGGRLSRRFFEALHGRSESVALDLTAEPGRRMLERLLLRADVVIEGSRPRALEQMGLVASDIARDGPPVWISITAQGRDHEHRDRVGFGDDAAAAGGLVGWIEGAPRFLADAVADPLTGLTAASVAAGLLACGDRWVVDVALSRVASAASGGWIPLDDGVIARPRSRRDPGAPMPLGRDTERVLRSLDIGSG